MMKYLVCLLLSNFLFSCASVMKDPQVNITNVDVADVTAKDITLNLKLNIINPNGIPINLKKVNYALQMSGKKIAEGVLNQGVNVPAKGQADVVVPVKFKFNTLDSLVSGLLKKTISKDYELTGTADLGIISIPFTKKGELDLKLK
ncbi:MAG: LEA type 2 family protein [Bdellovibrionaceae bacterium]|nr:LEA type 2 family protein [Bdellovibrio sp.]